MDLLTKTGSQAFSIIPEPIISTAMRRGKVLISVIVLIMNGKRTYSSDRQTKQFIEDTSSNVTRWCFQLNYLRLNWHHNRSHVCHEENI